MIHTINGAVVTADPESDDPFGGAPRELDWAVERDAALDGLEVRFGSEHVTIPYGDANEIAHAILGVTRNEDSL